MTSIIRIDSQGIDWGKRSMWWMRGVCERPWSTSWLLWVHPSASRESDRSKFWGHKTAQDGQNTQPRSSIWNDVSLGWIPDPKGNYTCFSNFLLAEFYQCLWATCPFEDKFRLEFIKERKRQWDIKKMIKKANNKVSYITSTNPAAAGKLMHENFKQHRCIG